MLNAEITRRGFIKSGGALIVGFSLVGPISEALGQTTPSGSKPVALDEVDAFLSIGQDGIVTV